MTDNEIVIALRAVAKNYEGKFVRTFETNINAMATDAADHIERLCEENNFLKAEIERLQKDIDIINAANTELYGAFEENERLKSEIERLGEDAEAYKDSIESLLSIVNSNYQNGRIDASKEFAENIKKELYLIRKECRKFSDNDGVFAIDQAIRKIDNLVKEMEDQH